MLTAFRHSLSRYLAFTGPQRRVMAVLLSIVFIFAAWQLAFNHTYIDNPQPAVGDLYSNLADRIDPNTADWPELAALPMLGEKRAKALIEYRQRVHQRGDARAFNSAEDLYRVDGFGPKLVAQLSPFLHFPRQQP